MSGMTREAFFEKWRDGPMDGSVNREMKSDLDAMLLAELRRAREEAVEECCKQICSPCRAEHPVMFHEGEWVHHAVPCDADAIRRLSRTGEGEASK